MPEVGKFYWVRFKAGCKRHWQPGQVMKTNGILWVGLIYDKSSFGVSSFEFGEELLPVFGQAEKIKDLEQQVQDALYQLTA